MKLLRKVTAGFAISVVTLQFSCAPTPEPRLQIGQAYAVNGIKYQPKVEPNYKEVGFASWYGGKFNKRRTANGDVFDKSEFTAAHKTLPLPSVVKVTNLVNGKSLNVIVNDRGPFVRGRIIDVSENAAKALGFFGHGTTKVMVELDKQASLALLKDPNLRINEAQKKLIVEAYTKPSMRSLKNSQESQLADIQQPQPPAAEQLAQQSYELTELHQQSKEHIQDTLTTQNLSPTSGMVAIPAPSEQKTVIVNATAKLKPVAPASMQQITLVRKPLEGSGKSVSAGEGLKENIKAIPNASTITSTTPYTIQVASATSEDDARKISSRLKNLSSKIQKANVNGKTYYRVHVTGLNTENAQFALNTIKSEGFKDAFILKGSK